MVAFVGSANVLVVHLGGLPVSGVESLPVAWVFKKRHLFSGNAFFLRACGQAVTMYALGISERDQLIGGKGEQSECLESARLRRDRICGRPLGSTFARGRGGGSVPCTQSRKDG